MEQMQASNQNTAFRRKWLPIFMVVAAGIVLFFALYFFPTVRQTILKLLDPISPVFYGLAIAYLLNPAKCALQRWMEKGFSKKKPLTARSKKAAKMLAITIVMLCFLAAIAGFCFLLIPELYRSVVALIDQFPEKSKQVIAWLEQAQLAYFSTGELAHLLEQALVNLQSWINTNLMSAVTDAITVVTNGVITAVTQVFYIIVGFVVTVYALSETDNFKRQGKKLLFALLPTKSANQLMDSMRHGNQIFSGYVTGKIIDSFLVGVICFVGLSILQIPYALLISVVIAVTDLIPVFGPFIGTIPCAFLLLIESPLHCLYFVLFILVLQQIDGNIIAPRILGEATGISTFWVTFSLLFFGGMFGLPGMVLGVPLFSVLYFMAKMFVDSRLEKKALPANADWGHVDRVDEAGALKIITAEQKEAAQMAQKIAKKQAAAERRAAKKQVAGDDTLAQTEEPKED